jgi:hypothetical protein
MTTQISDANFQTATLDQLGSGPRITSGTARYTTNFTPATTAFNTK